MQASSGTESGEPAGPFPPWLSAILQSSSRDDEAGEQQQPVQLPPLLSDLLRSICGKTEQGDPNEERPNEFELRCLVSLAKAYLPAPPPPPPAREIPGYIKRQHVLYARPEVIIEQSKKFAKGALEHHNKRKKIKFELVDVMPVIMMPESGRHYTHVNFTARSNKEGSQEKLFFAELSNCSKRKAPGGYLVTCCEPLGSDSTVGHKGFQRDGSSKLRKNVDFTCCFACTPRMHHPKGHKYVAGHCNIPYIYSSTC